MSKSRQSDGGYIAVARGIFDHLLFKEERSLSRLEAWLWLVANAAWKPSGARRRHGVVHLERAQVATTVRGLAATWQWPKTTVERFLEELVAEGLVLIARAFGTRIGTRIGTRNSYPITLITICKYNKFQGTPKSAGAVLGQVSGQDMGQDLVLPLEIPMTCAHQPFLTKESINKELKRSGEQGQREKPHHGAKGRGMVWLDHGTSEWAIYAEDYREARGAERLPENRVGGKGNWFRWAGEAKQKRG